MYEYECKVFFQLVEMHNTHTIRGYCFEVIVVAKYVLSDRRERLITTAKTVLFAYIANFNGVQCHLKFPELLRIIRYMINSHVLLQHRNGERASPVQ